MVANIAKKTALLLSFILVLGWGQGIQLSKSWSDVNYAALEQWSSGDAERQRRVEQFDLTCIRNSTADTKSISKPMMVDQCAKANQLEDVFAVYKQSGSALKSIAWPLSIVVDSLD